LFGAQTAFDADLYRGAHWDDTYAERGSPSHPIANMAPRTKALSESDVARERSSWDERRADKVKLPAQFADLETRASFYYVSGIVDLARARGIQVRFLYLPCYGDPETPEHAAFYATQAQTWSPPAAVLTPIAHWYDINHLNYEGALALSQWTGEQVATALARRAPEVNAASNLPASHVRH
jgi:hypothetical protein